MKFRSLALLTLALLVLPASSQAGIDNDLKRMTGFTIIYGGYIKDRIKRNYTDRLIQLDNGWIFKLDCMILMPLNLTDVVVFGKRYPESLINQYPKLPEYALYQFKLLIDSEICDASMVQ